MSRVVVTSSIALGAVVLAFASCANTEVASPEQEDASSSVGAVDAGGDTDAAPEAAACDVGDPGCVSTVVRCEDAAWCPVAAPVDPRCTLTAVWGTGKDDVLAVGSGGTILRWDGKTWTLLPAPENVKNTFFAIWGSGPDDVWLGSGTSVLFHASARTQGRPDFKLVENLTGDPFNSAAIYAIWGSGRGDVRIGGGIYAFDTREGWGWGNQFVRGAPDDQWAKVGGAAIVSSIWGTAANDVWVAADNSAVEPWQKGMILHGTGADPTSLVWTAVDSQAAVPLTAIWGSSADDVWAVGESGTIRHLGAGAVRWEIVPSPTTAHLRRLWGTGPKDIWAVGDRGTILHYDGTAWKPSLAALPLGEKPKLYGVWGSSAGDVWIVGDGIVLRSTGKTVVGGGS